MKGCFDRFLNTSFALTCWWFERAHREAQQDNLLLFAKIWQNDFINKNSYFKCESHNSQFSFVQNQ